MYESEHVLLKTQWEGWARKDGTNTTWVSLLPGDNTVIKAWLIKGGKRRNSEAKESPDIDLNKLLSFMPHQLKTAQNACAFKEKKQKWSTPKISCDPERPHSSHASLARSTPISASANAGPSKRQRAISTSSSGEGEVTMAIRKSKRRHSEMAPQRPSQAALLKPNSVRFGEQESVTSLREQVENEWNKSIRRIGAAPIRIFNDIDDEAIPTTGVNFTYMENQFAPCVPYQLDLVPSDFSTYSDDDIPNTDLDFLSGCECEDNCIDPLRCLCIAESDCVDEQEDMSSPYSAEVS